MDVGAILERFLDRPRVAYIRAVLDTYGRAAGGLLANGLAFAALFATIPVALVTLGLAGWLVDDPRFQVALAKALVDVFPPLRNLITESLAALTTGAPITSVVGLIGLIWTVSQLYVTLDIAFARIYSDTPERDVLRRTARGLLWVGALLAGVVIVIVVGSLAALVDAFVSDGVSTARVVASVLTSLPALLVITIVVVSLMYRILPPASPDWSAVWAPAVAVGFIVVGLSQAFAFLAPRLVGVAALTGTLATLFVALAWLSFTFQALLYGAAWVRVRNEWGRRPVGSALGRAAATAESGSRGE
ncbi:MAG: YihY/virulence factor BrkB family protein [Candidatus Limnocylindrales bacterium]